MTDNMTTSEFWEYCNRLRDTRSGNKKRDILIEMMRNNKEVDVKRSIRLMLGNPFSNPETSMGVGKKTVRKALTRIYDTNYDEVREYEKEIGNLSEVPEKLSRPNPLTAQPRVGVLSVLVDNLSGIAGSNRDNVQRVAHFIQDSEDPHVAVFALLSPKKDVSLGIGWKKVRDACVKGYGVDKSRVERLHGIGYNADEIAASCIRDEFEDLRDTVYPFDRVRPMLASSVSLPDNDSWWVGQTKYDGGRLLIHVLTGSEPGTGEVEITQDIEAHTRQRHEISDNLPELGEVNWPHTDFIVDAEAVGYDPETGDVLPFQQFMERFQREKNIDEKAEEVEIGFRLFDLLYWENQDLTTTDYDERLAILEDNFPANMVATTYGDLDKAFEEALEAGHEGIIAKDVTAEYEFDRSRSWMKVKPVKEPVELRVSGVVAGSGRRAGTLGALKLETQEGTSVGRVGTGFTDPELDELWEMHQKDELVGSIVEIEYEEFQERDGKYGLRFPRYLRLRPQSDAEIDSMEALQDS